MSSLAIPTFNPPTLLKYNSEGIATEYVLPPSLSLGRKRAASCNLRHVKVHKKPRVSQQFGQAIKSVIRRKVMTASIISSKKSGSGVTGRARSNSINGSLGDDSILSESFIAERKKEEERKKEKEEQEAVKKEKVNTKEDLEKINLEIEKVSRSIVELKAKKKEQFSQLKIMLRAEKQKQKQAAKEAAERQRRLAAAAATAADYVKVEYVQDRPTMLSVNKTYSSK